MALNKRILSLQHSDSPLTSKRVKYILNNPEDAQKLAASIRAGRKGKENTFELSPATQQTLDSLS